MVRHVGENVNRLQHHADRHKGIGRENREQRRMNKVAEPLVSPPFKRVHIEWLDSLRGLAALYVLISHIVNTAFRVEHGMSGVVLLLVAPFRYGHFAVGLFIVLSGYSLMLPVTLNNGELRKGALDFYWRRAKKILPP